MAFTLDGNTERKYVLPLAGRRHTARLLAAGLNGLFPVVMAVSMGEQETIWTCKCDGDTGVGLRFEDAPSLVTTYFNMQLNGAGTSVQARDRWAALQSAKNARQPLDAGIIKVVAEGDRLISVEIVEGSNGPNSC